MSAAARPRLRPHLAAAAERGQLYLYDPHRIAGPPVPVSRRDVDALNRLDGTRTAAEAAAEAGIPARQFADLVDALDAGLFLDGDTLLAYLNGPDRRPSCIGCYPEDPAAIPAAVAPLFVGPGGPGLPNIYSQPARRLRAVLAPHMDYARGGVTYGWAFADLAARTAAELFVIVATSHYSGERFTLTRKNYRTPLGTVPTDTAYLDRIQAVYGPGLYADPVAHLPEHSIELEVLLMQHVLKDRPFRIVPLLVGSFHDCVAANRSPGDFADIARMVAALRAAEAAAGEEVCYVISGDLAHVGPKFRDPDPVGEPFLTYSKSQDERILAHLATADADGYFREIAAEGDRRRICGLPPTWLTLAAARPAAGRVLHYGRSIDPTGHESVSFAAAGFDE